MYFFVSLQAYNPNNETMSSTVNIDINVLDVNDNPPEFLQHTNNVYTVTVREDITINTEVGLTMFIQSLYVRIQQLILR